MSFGLKGSLKSNGAGFLSYATAAQDNKELSVSTRRKKGGLGFDNPVGMEEGDYYVVRT